jgi:LPXTG-motif cell wall-anchored protein
VTTRSPVPPVLVPGITGQQVPSIPRGGVSAGDGSASRSVGATPRLSAGHGAPAAAIGGLVTALGLLLLVARRRRQVA